MGDLSPHFSKAELACHCCGTLKIDRRLVDALEELRSLAGKPIVIHDGYRWANHNQEVGGVLRATDVRPRARSSGFCTGWHRCLRPGLSACGRPQALHAVGSRERTIRGHPTPRARANVVGKSWSRRRFTLGIANSAARPSSIAGWISHWQRSKRASRTTTAADIPPQNPCPPRHLERQWPNLSRRYLPW